MTGDYTNVKLLTDQAQNIYCKSSSTGESDLIKMDE